MANLKVPAMIVYDVATKVLDTESFLQHTIADLSSDITFIVLLSQEKPLRRKETNTYTHIFNYDFSEKELGIVSPQYLAHDFFSRKKFCFTDCEVVLNNLILLIKPFSYMTKKSRQKFHGNEKGF